MSAAMEKVLPDRDTVAEMLRSFLAWLEGYGYETFDPYDLWSTRAGRFCRRVYYENHLLGLPLVLPILFIDHVAPGVRSLVAARKRYPIADAHLILGCIELYRSTREEKHLERAEQLAQDLLRQSITGYSGHCWGFPFDWESSGGWIPKGTPLITTTPYCFEAFLSLYDVSGNRSYLAVAESAAAFASKDLTDTATSSHASASSYTPYDRSRVVNASSYRAMMLLEAHARFGVDEYRRQALRNVNYVLEAQRDDGSWLYEPGSVNNAFIDNFHTCFTIKNLVKANRHLGDGRVEDAIASGYRYYREYLIDPEGFPRPFSYGRRFHPVRLEGYDLAEGITLGVLMRERFPDALEHAQRLCALADRVLRLPQGYFAARISRTGLRTTIPYLRWPLAQMFHGLALLHSSLGD